MGRHKKNAMAPCVDGPSNHKSETAKSLPFLDAFDAYCRKPSLGMIVTSGELKTYRSLTLASRVRILDITEELIQQHRELDTSNGLTGRNRKKCLEYLLDREAKHMDTLKAILAGFETANAERHSKQRSDDVDWLQGVLTNFGKDLASLSVADRNETIASSQPSSRRTRDALKLSDGPSASLRPSTNRLGLSSKNTQNPSGLATDVGGKKRKAHHQAVDEVIMDGIAHSRDRRKRSTHHHPSSTHELLDGPAPPPSLIKLQGRTRLLSERQTHEANRGLHSSSPAEPTRLASLLGSAISSGTTTSSDRRSSFLRCRSPPVPLIGSRRSSLSSRRPSPASPTMNLQKVKRMSHTKGTTTAISPALSAGYDADTSDSEAGSGVPPAPVPAPARAKVEANHEPGTGLAEGAAVYDGLVKFIGISGLSMNIELPVLPPGTGQTKDEQLRAMDKMILSLERQSWRMSMGL